MKANLISRTTMMSLFLSAAVASGAAMAQDAPKVPDHPRVNEVNQRLDNQQDRIDKGVASGKLNAKQATRDENHDANIAARESADEAKHGGHLTKVEKRHLNKSLNKNNHRIHHQRHHNKVAK